MRGSNSWTVRSWPELKPRIRRLTNQATQVPLWCGVFFFNILNHTIFSFPLALCVSVWFCLIKCSLCMKPLTAGTSQLLRKYWRTVRKMAKQCTNLKAEECLRDKNIHTFNTLCFHNTNYRSKSLTNLHRRASLPQPGWGSPHVVLDSGHTEEEKESRDILRGRRQTSVSSWFLVPNIIRWP